MTNAIVTRQLTKYYGDKCVVNQLNMSIPQGSIYGFLGRNGAGKSTTIKMLMGLVHPDYGSAQLLGENSASIAPHTRAKIAYLVEGHPVYKWMSVGEAIDFTRRSYTLWNGELIDQILDHFQLPRKSKIRRLSNGQRAQVSLALAVAPEPELLILDDPTLGLDTVVRRDFLESLVQIIQRKGRTILFSSHVLGDIERVADRIGIMIDGVLRVDCPTEYFKESMRKIVLTFAETPPDYPVCLGLVGSWKVGKRLEVNVVNYDDEHRRIAESLDPISIDITRLNLEDAFIEYTRGSRRALPYFAGDASHVESNDLQGVA